MNNEANVNKRSTIIKDALILFAITLIAGLALGYVHEATLPAIEAQKIKDKMEAYQSVFPEATQFMEDESLTAKAETAAEDILVPKGYDNISINEVRIAADDAGTNLGYVVMVTTGEGYGGDINISLGYALDGTVKGIEIISMSETAGLGAKAKEKVFKDQYSNKKVNEFTVTKTGAVKDNEIDALSGATITSKAVTGAVNAGICFLTSVAETGNNAGGN
jgi:Na+-translocating ferredoxin:NAD+ oxidoreductase subunit G